MWSYFTLPLTFFNLLMAWILLTIVQAVMLSRARKKDGDRGMEMANGGSAGQQQQQTTSVRAVVKEERRRLGPLSAEEISISICFFILILLWLFRDPKIIPGWGGFFKTTKFSDPNATVTVGDASAAILMVVVVFSLPTKYNFWPFVKMRDAGRSPALIEWGGPNGVEKRLPWGVIILLGGGFALSKACQDSGLSQFLADKMHVLSSWPPLATSAFICAVTAGVTEVASNTATANVVVPILVDISMKLCQNPISLGT